MPEDDSVLPAISVSRTSTESRNSRASSSNSRSKQAEQHPHDDAEAGAAAARRRSQWASGGGTSPGPNHARKKAAYARWRFGKQQAGGGGTWKRVRDPEPEWKIAWDGQCFPNGRVLIIDYISSDDTATSSTATKNSDGKRHTRIQAQEFQVLSELERFYADPRRVQDVALRVVHVQNAAWATAFLIGKFNMDHRDEMVGMPGFSRWAKYEKPRQRNGKPFPYGRTWRPQTDPWRNVSRTAFGMDYLKPYETPAPDKRGLFPAGGRTVEAKLLHLNAYEDGHSPHGFDVSVQRVSVYAQRSLGPASLHLSPDVDIRNPYLKKPGAGGAAEGKKSSSSRNNGAPPTSSVPEASAVDKKRAFLRAYDNGNTVIVFETSASRQLDDCLIQPRNDFENRWRRLSFFLSKEDALNDNRLAAQCTNIILADVFHGLRENWGLLLAAAANHVALLEDKIYENPADESRAPELWTNQAHWLKVDKVLWLHSDIVREMQGHLRDLAEADHDAAVPEPGGPVELDWLANTPAEYDRVAHSINEDLIQPTNNLSDLMYKSVGIRDSRQSLQLGLSMWRLSWITFIFLPLNFITSFWGMNSSLFEYFPSVGWYFLSAAILMLFGECHPLCYIIRTLTNTMQFCSCGMPSSTPSNDRAKHPISAASTKTSSTTSKKPIHSSGPAMGPSTRSTRGASSTVSNGACSNAGLRRNAPSTRSSTARSRPMATPPSSGVGTTSNEICSYAGFRTSVLCSRMVRWSWRKRCPPLRKRRFISMTRTRLRRW